MAVNRKLIKYITTAITIVIVISIMAVSSSAVIMTNVDMNQIAQILDYGYVVPFYYIYTDGLGVSDTTAGTYVLSSVYLPVSQVNVMQLSYVNRFKDVTETNVDFDIIAINNLYNIYDETFTENDYNNYCTLLQIKFDSDADVIAIQVEYNAERSFSHLGVGIVDMQLYPEVSISNIKDYTTILTGISSKLSSINRGVEEMINPDPTVLERIQDALKKQEDQQEQLDDIVDALNSTEKPTMDELNIGGFYDDLDIQGAPVMTAMSQIMNMTIVLQPLVIVLSVALISFILLGKR